MITATGFWLNRRRKMGKETGKRRHRTGTARDRLEAGVLEAMLMAIDDLGISDSYTFGEEKVGHSRTGGASMLKAWFGKGLLGRKNKDGTYTGKKGRRYRVTRSGSQYTITRLK
jgi:hypothetical protein